MAIRPGPLDVIAGLLLALALLVPAESPAAERDGRLLLIPSADTRAPMRTMVYRPAGAGPFPLAIVGHGTSSNAELRRLQRLSRFRELARWFVGQGYVVAVPQRPGHGGTGEAWAEDYGTCSDPHYFQAGLAIARNIDAAIDYMIKQPHVRRSGVVLVGHSAGAWGALALASRKPKKVAAVIDFAGGLGGRSYDWPNRNCAPERLIETAGKFGSTARAPTLWLYARNDSYFGPALAEAMAKSYRRAGGRVEFHLLPSSGDDGHFLVFDKESAPDWEPIVARFLRKLSRVGGAADAHRLR